MLTIHVCHISKYTWYKTRCLLNSEQCESFPRTSLPIRHKSTIFPISQSFLDELTCSHFINPLRRNSISNNIIELIMIIIQLIDSLITSQCIVSSSLSWRNIIWYSCIDIEFCLDRFGMHALNLVRWYQPCWFIFEGKEWPYSDCYFYVFGSLALLHWN